MQVTPKKRAKLIFSVKNISLAVVEINNIMTCLHPMKEDNPNKE